MSEIDPSEQKDRLRLALKLAGLPDYGAASHLARNIGTSPQAVIAVLKGSDNGGSKALNAYNTAKAAKFLRVDWFWLATGEGVPQVEGGEVIHEPRKITLPNGKEFWAIPREWKDARDAIKKASGEK
jgi:transcriptional regulator with XRE-family HTH domain